MPKWRRSSLGIALLHPCHWETPPRRPLLHPVVGRRFPRRRLLHPCRWETVLPRHRLLHPCRWETPPRLSPLHPCRLGDGRVLLCPLCPGPCDLSSLCLGHGYLKWSADLRQPSRPLSHLLTWPLALLEPCRTVVNLRLPSSVWPPGLCTRPWFGWSACSSHSLPSLGCQAFISHFQHHLLQEVLPWEPQSGLYHSILCVPLSVLELLILLLSLPSSSDRELSKTGTRFIHHQPPAPALARHLAFCVGFVQ